jgi:hypothetical protein
VRAPASLVWLVAATIVVAGFAGETARRNVVRCGGAFEQAPIPPGWESWPSTPSDWDWKAHTLFGLRLDYGPSAMGPKYPGFAHTELVDPALCPRSGVSLDDWFVRGPSPYWSRHPSELFLRHDEASGVYVVSGQGMSGDMRFGPELGVVAFRRQLGDQHAFASERALAAFVMLVLGGGVGVAFAVVAAARLRQGTERAARAGRIGLLLVAVVLALLAVGSCAVDFDDQLGEIV